MRIAIIDNYDSFTFNLVHYIEAHADLIHIIRYDQIKLDELDNYDAILISPGPGHPNEYKNNFKIIDQYHCTKAILGICLGHQIIGAYFKAKLENMQTVVHGEKHLTKLTNNSYLFNGIPKSFYSGRYHSWIIKNIPENFLITAIDSKTKHIMAISHKKYNIHGIQFHPESVMTEYGKKIIRNWIKNIF